MIKCLLIAGIAFAPAVFALDGAACIVPVDNTGAAPTSTAYIPTPSGHREIIYDDQTYDYDAVFTATVFCPPYKIADDFEADEDWTLEMNRVWVLTNDPGSTDILVEIFADSGAGPADDGVLFAETVSENDQTWTDTGDSKYGYDIYEVDIPISGFDIDAGTRYWLSLQDQGDTNKFWALMDGHVYDYWDPVYIYYYGEWVIAGIYIFQVYECMFELHGTPGEDVDPEVTETYPHDSDFPSGVPVGTDVTFHVADDVSGCDTEVTTCTVEESGSSLPGDLIYDDSDPLDVAFTWEPDDDYTEGVSIYVEVVTYDLAGNGPVTEEWSFTTGYVNVAPASLGVIKAGFAE